MLKYFVKVSTIVWSGADKVETPLGSPKLLTMRVVRRGTLLRNIAELRGKYHDDSTFWLAQSDKTFRPSRMRILMVRWAEVN